MKIAQAAEIVLNDAQKAMRAQDIANAIVSKKLFEFKTSDKASVVSNSLRKSARFKKISPGVFELVG